MKIRTQIVTALALLLGGLNIAKAQTITPKSDALHALSMESYEAFIKSAKPLLEQMGAKKIVGLGEGTHGTAEFYKLRYWITRMLVERKGFNRIAFENDFSDLWLLNKQLAGTTNLNELMRKYMLSIWQNEETKELLNWVKNYNSKHKRKVQISGIDYVYVKPDIELLEGLLVKEPLFLPLVAQLKKPALFQDTTWEGMNRDDFKLDMNALTKSSYAGYLLADSLDKKLSQSSLSAAVKADCHLSLLNIKQAFAPFYHMTTNTPEPSRDVNMAQTATLLLKGNNDKMVIWAHDAHLAKKGIFKGEVGGMGGELLKSFPNNYFVLGTGTANGTFAATKESRDTYTNPMAPYPLATPIKDSWEELLVKVNPPIFYFHPAQFNSKGEIKPLRFVGYGPDSGAKVFDNTNISDLFDAYLFIKDSHAATPLK